MENQPAALNIPSEVYYVIGALVVMNFGTFVTIVFAAIKVVWWAAKADSRINEAKAMGVRAHKRIDGIQEGGEE